mmetsp:Transcript_9948/g.23194  ORF Transcript_9948/g.23194 Transcript_9948/m.23194 type:complete len:233 (+) Transcript_9948:751-1449(+)
MAGRSSRENSGRMRCCVVSVTCGRLFRTSRSNIETASWCRCARSQLSTLGRSCWWSPIKIMCWIDGTIAARTCASNTSAASSTIRTAGATVSSSERYLAAPVVVKPMTRALRRIAPSRWLLSVTSSRHSPRYSAEQRSTSACPCAWSVPAQSECSARRLRSERDHTSVTSRSCASLSIACPRRAAARAGPPPGSSSSENSPSSALATGAGTARRGPPSLPPPAAAAASAASS